MSEEFLYYLWRYKRFDTADLLDTEGIPLQIIHEGSRNEHSGPDFFNAKIKIGDTLWGGNVEIHVRSSDWYKHNHQEDKSYDNVILHVVYEHDREIVREDGSMINTLELKGRFDEMLFKQYDEFMQSRSLIPCANMIQEVDPLLINACLDRMSIERLEQKFGAIEKMLEHSRYDWEQTLLQLLARSFGFKLNTLPFELLIKRTPLKQLQQFSEQTLVEALLFGTAGMLSGPFQEAYPQQLAKEFNWMQSKWKIVSVDPFLWKFMRLRPNNFPTVRIAQLAALLFQQKQLFSKILETPSAEELIGLLDVQASEYWNRHYRFNKESTLSIKKLGKASAVNLIINAIVPLLFAYGKKKNQEHYKEKALVLLEELPGEQNKVTNLWKELELKVSTAHHSQALLQLTNNYCNKKQCLQCNIGNKLLHQETVLRS